MEQWLSEQLSRQNKPDLTIVQTMAIEAGVDKGVSMVVCAPTSAGKTLIGEIAMLCQVRAGRVALYLVSHKALAEQKYEEFRSTYGEDGFARVAISTGDRDAGDADPQIIVATYERALSLVIGGAIDIRNTVVVADELQLIGEDKRGPEVELLCTLLRTRKPAQFVALTATIENGDDLSGWLDCKLVKSSARDVQLIQEIWSTFGIYSLAYGQDVPQITKSRDPISLGTVEVVESLLRQERGPILVFVETRRDAMELASSFSSRRAKTESSANFTEQLELFSEGTEFSERLKSTAGARAAFHTADLTPSERKLVEDGLSDRSFDVCFATPTLAAGVNFPFQSVVFDRIRRRFIPPPLLPTGAYRNMSGRAGRLGLHHRGFAILLPRDEEERIHATNLVQQENERLFSKLSTMSVRKIALSLVASGVVTSTSELRSFLEQTLFWHQVRDRNASRLSDLIVKLEDAVRWLAEYQMIRTSGVNLNATELGIATAKSGLLPSSALRISSLLKSNLENLGGDFHDHELALIAAMCGCEEFDPEIGQRFLPQVAPGHDSTDLISILNNSPKLSGTPVIRRGVGNAAVAVFLFASGEAENRIASRTGIPSGQIHRFAADIAWILDGAHRLAGVHSNECSQQIMNQVNILSHRVRAGVPAAILDILKIAQRAAVPGLGRQRAVALLKNKLSDRDSILNADKRLLEKILVTPKRVEGLIAAVANVKPDEADRSRSANERIADELGIGDAVRRSYNENGAQYGYALAELFGKIPGWRITPVRETLDTTANIDGYLLQIATSDGSILVACKTQFDGKDLPIGRNSAFSVIKVETPHTATHFITIARPRFDLMAEAAACSSSEITLVNHSSFITALIAQARGKATTDQLLEWLREPGVAEIERLAGAT